MPIVNSLAAIMKTHQQTFPELFAVLQKYTPTTEPTPSKLSTPTNYTLNLEAKLVTLEEADKKFTEFQEQKKHQPGEVIPVSFENSYMLLKVVQSHDPSTHNSRAPFTMTLVELFSNTTAYGICWKKTKKPFDNNWTFLSNLPFGGCIRIEDFELCSRSKSWDSSMFIFPIVQQDLPDFHINLTTAKIFVVQDDQVRDWHPSLWTLAHAKTLGYYQASVLMEIMPDYEATRRT